MKCYQSSSERSEVPHWHFVVVGNNPIPALPSVRRRDWKPASEWNFFAQFPRNQIQKDIIMDDDLLIQFLRNDK